MKSFLSYKSSALIVAAAFFFISEISASQNNSFSMRKGLLSAIVGLSLLGNAGNSEPKDCCKEHHTQRGKCFFELYMAPSYKKAGAETAQEKLQYQKDNKKFFWVTAYQATETASLGCLGKGAHRPFG